MRILVWGLGYVGTVTAACLAQLGHEVIGIDPNVTKVEWLNQGRSPIKEQGLDELVAAMVEAGRLRTTSDGISHIPEADVSLICVGTPSSADGDTRLTYLHNVATEIGQGLRASERYHVVIVRSTVFPGTSRGFFASLLAEQSGRVTGQDFGLVMNPEFLREASAIFDFREPPYTIIGEWDARSGDVASALYEDIDAPLYRVTLEEAEMLKLLNNAFHSLKIGFANEVGRLSDQLNVDSHRVMELLCADTKLNISPAYLKPGFAFGGSCLPKDLRSLLFNSRLLGVNMPIIEAILPSNQRQIELARIKIQQTGAQKVGILGLSFKPGTDDLRESPIISLIRTLWQDGVDLLVHDPEVRLEEMLGSNKRYLERQLPQIHDIFREDVADVLEGSQLIVVSQKRSLYTQLIEELPEDVAVLDLVRLFDVPSGNTGAAYQGIAW